MPHRRSPAGWVVQLAVPGPKPEPTTIRGANPADSPRLRFYNVAVSSPDQAIEAVRNLARVPADAAMRIVRQLSPAEVAATHLHDGEVKPA